MTDNETRLPIAERFRSASTLQDFVSASAEHGALWHAIIVRARKAELPADILARANAIGAPRYVLILLEDWCGDAVNTAPVIDALGIAVPSIQVRAVSRDANDDLMQAHLSPRGGRAIPAVIVYDENFKEIGWWGSRPDELQKWVDSAAAQALEKKVRYAGARRWYVDDRGRSTLAELIAILERKAA